MPANPGSCPYLWLASDPSLRLSYADGGHRCFALVGAQEYRPDDEYQQKYCLTEAHTYCPRYHPPSADRPFDPEAFLEAADKPSPSPLRVVAGIVLGVIALVVVWRLASALLTTCQPACCSAQNDDTNRSRGACRCDARICASGNRSPEAGHNRDSASLRRNH